MMSLQIGTKIKALRKARGITQEQLAEAIGISYQAVSKWETNIALPDITLAPVLASYFGITMDELFDYDLSKTEEKVKAICDEAYKYRFKDPEKSRQMLEDGLKQYPDNDVILNNILYTLDEVEDAEQVIAIALKLTGSSDDAVKYDALRILATAYALQGDMASAEAAIERIPEIYFSKLSVAAQLLKGDKGLEAAHKETNVTFGSFLEAQLLLSEHYEEKGNIAAAIAEAKKARRIINACFDGGEMSAYCVNMVKNIDEDLQRLKVL